jgi:hypothetical protein
MRVRRFVVDEWTQRVMPVEPNTVEVVSFTLVPAGRGDDVDDRRGETGANGDRLQMSQAVRPREQRPDQRAV